MRSPRCRRAARRGLGAITDRSGLRAIDDHSDVAWHPFDEVRRRRGRFLPGTSGDRKREENDRYSPRCHRTTSPPALQLPLGYATTDAWLVRLIDQSSHPHHLTRQNPNECAPGVVKRLVTTLTSGRRHFGVFLFRLVGVGVRIAHGFPDRIRPPVRELPSRPALPGQERRAVRRPSRARSASFRRRRGAARSGRAAAPKCTPALFVECSRGPVG